jgi:peroxiredoxin
MKLSMKVITVASLLLVISLLLAACTGTGTTAAVTQKAVKTPIPEPTVFKIDSLAVNPSEINAGVQTLVTAKITNTKGVDNEYQGSIRVDNTTTPSLPTFLGSDIVTIPAGATQLLSVPMTIRDPGIYNVSWDGVSQSLVVNPQEVSNQTNPQSSGSRAAPDFSAADVVTGKTVSLKQFTGSAILLTFVNYGCNPQTNQVVGAQLLTIRQLQSQRSDFVPVSVFCGCCPPDVLRQFAKENNLNWPWILDSDYSIARNYAGYLQRYGYPTLVFIDKDTSIIDTAGYLNTASLNTKLNDITAAGSKN